MGIIRTAIGAAAGTVKSGFQDQFLEAIEPEEMDAQTVFTRGVMVRKGSNRPTTDVISDGSVIHVYDNQFMILVDGGKIIDYTAEPGYYTVSNSSAPSMFNGQFDEALKETFSRFKFGGTTPMSQKVFYINLQEIKGIKFGTRNAVNYFDSFYNAELFLRAHGTYSIKITDPLKFYAEVVPKNAQRVEIEEINDQYRSEFLEALQSAINRMSAEGMRISFVTSKAMELGRYMADVLDTQWTQQRGMEIQAVGIASISYDEESQKLINMRNQGAMMSDPSVREGFVRAFYCTGNGSSRFECQWSSNWLYGHGNGHGSSRQALWVQASQNAICSEMQTEFRWRSSRRMMQQQTSSAAAATGSGLDLRLRSSLILVTSVLNCGKPKPSASTGPVPAERSTKAISAANCGKPRA